MSTRWCGRCRSLQTIDWQVDHTFGAAAEAARCPACGAVWGVRERRKTWISQSPGQADSSGGAFTGDHTRPSHQAGQA